MDKRLSFRDLVALNIVASRRCLLNWVLYRNFPPGERTAPNRRTWLASEVFAWVNARPTGPDGTPIAARRGRPRSSLAAAVEPRPLGRPRKVRPAETSSPPARASP